MIGIEGLLCLYLVKNYLIFIFTGLIPLIRTYKPFYLPICITKECANNFNLLLMNEKTFNCFFKFLREEMPSGAKLLNFWIDVNLFRHNQRKNMKVHILATDLYNKYINPNSEFYIDFPSKLIEGFNKSYLKTDKSFYNNIFDELSEFVYESLNDYHFPSFKNSDVFKKLEKELENEEIVYSRLIQSNMISTKIYENI